jgi:exodeoxyribonuclease VIII
VENVMENVMIDLETLGTTPGSIIISIGACFFSTDGGPCGAMFHDVVNVASSCTYGLRGEEGTIKWWGEQSHDARKVYHDAMYGHGNDLKQVLEGFNSFLIAQGPGDGLKNVKVWGNGAAFDNAILAAAYKAAGLTYPFAFWNDRCFRTLKALGKDLGVSEPPFQGVRHNALDDAVHQANWALAIFGTLNDMKEDAGFRAARKVARAELKKPLPRIDVSAEGLVEAPKAAREWPCCAVCNKPMFPTSSGLVCEKGHGGAE